MSLKEELESLLSGNIVILGIGNELRADDGAGVTLTQRLLEDLNNNNRVTIISAGSAPENYIRNVLASQPNAIILVDTAETGGRPGEISLQTAESLANAHTSTHALSPKIMMKMLSLSSTAQIRLLTIQPKSLSLNGEMTPEVKEAVEQLERMIVEIVGSHREDTPDSR